ncbi:MAG: hypothetical protein ABJK11_08740 [Balneola sp.]
MSYKFYSQVLLSAFLIFALSCDSTFSPDDFDEHEPYVQDLSVNPGQIIFNAQQDGQKDTTVVLSLSVNGFNFEGDSLPYYSIFLDDENLPSIQGAFNKSSVLANTFEANVSILTSTIVFKTYTVLATPTLNGNNKNYAQSVISQTGVPINAPQILEVNNPNQVEIPSGSTTTIVLFTAKVTDMDGQDNLSQVLLNFRNSDGSMLSDDPFQMFDDGISNGGDTSGDEVAGDSVFTKSFSINSGNTPANRTAVYWAIDKSGLSSDTLETIFNIVDNE